MVNWTSRWKKFGGWFGEQTRHSNAAKYGKAGGKYRYFAKKKDEKVLRRIIKTPSGGIVGEDYIPKQVKITNKLKKELKGKPDVTPEMEARAEKADVEAAKVLNEAKKVKESVQKTEIAPEELYKMMKTAEKAAVSEARKELRQPREKYGKYAPTATNEAYQQALYILGKGGSLKEAKAEAMKQYERRGFTPAEAQKLFAPEEKLLMRMAKEEQTKKIEKFREKHLEPVVARAETAIAPLLPKIETPREKALRMQAERSIKAMSAAEKRAEEEQFREATGGPSGVNPFNPLKINFGDIFATPTPLKDSLISAPGPEQRAPTKEELHPEAVHIEQEVNDLHAGRGALKDNKSKSIFDRGVSAFSGGDREKLVESINDLQAEKRKLLDRNVWLDQTRGRLLKEETKQSFIDMEGSGSGLFNFSFGGGSGTRKLADMSKKITEAKADVWKEVNKNEIRMHNLTDKLARLDANMNPGRFEPVTPESGDILPFHGVASTSLFVGIDNPLLSKKEAKPLLKSKTVDYLLFNTEKPVNIGTFWEAKR